MFVTLWKLWKFCDFMLLVVSLGVRRIADNVRIILYVKHVFFFHTQQLPQFLKNEYYNIKSENYKL